LANIYILIFILDHTLYDFNCENSIERRARGRIDFSYYFMFGAPCKHKDELGPTLKVEGLS
jgi:hypothetical protein